jgi:hypothetical protein
MSMACAIMFLKLHIILYQLLGRWISQNGNLWEMDITKWKSLGDGYHKMEIFGRWISQNGNLWEMDITKCESLGFHVRTDFTTCLKIDPQGDMHPTLVKTQNIL